MSQTSRSNAARRRSRQAGFSLIELLVGLSIIGLMAALGFPAFQRMVHQSRLMGFTERASVLLAKGRLEAIRVGADVVAQPDFAKREIFVFVNVDGDADLQYQPNPALTARTADYAIGRIQLPTETAVAFQGPADKNPGGADTIEGLTAMKTGENAVVFQRDGSVRDTGAIRVADTRGNFFELRIEPVATGRIEIRKYNSNPAWGGAAGFYPAGFDPGTDAPLWVWY